MSPALFSIIIPVYNRPDELRELLDSLTLQTDRGFEVIIVEDGSTVSSAHIAQEYGSRLQLSYYTKPNEGPGLTRNYGAARAAGDYFIFFDSDCLIPPRYIEIVRERLRAGDIPLFGGPDAAHSNFTPTQKAISYSMTALLTTGGIRGAMKDETKYHPRSYNMGFSRAAWEATGGFSNMRFGEDLDLTLRAIAAGFQARLIREAYVYHKRRTDFTKFFRQVFNSGIARINLHKRHPGTLKVTHLFPAAFVIGSIGAILFLMAGIWWPAALLGLYLLAIWVDAARHYHSLHLGWLSMRAAIVQHYGYGLGFLKAVWLRLILGKGEFEAYRKNFYK